ncbi:MAG: hypothetical protein C0392_12790 [Syntrophus sp. (in: bacteria)]|nr:hypothetical protein [Syntrophus sp. (in: bacteria)]
MKKEMVIIRSDKGTCEDTGAIEEILKKSGWDVETIGLSKGEPLPRGLENVGGLLILGDNMNVYDQNAYPFLNVYFNM